MHDIGIEHCDIWLENICFDPLSEHIVFIDLDRAENRIHLGPFRFCSAQFYMYSTTTCMFSNLEVPSVDFVQLGYMVLWISHFCETVNGFEFYGNSLKYTNLLDCKMNLNLLDISSKKVQSGTIQQMPCMSMIFQLVVFNLMSCSNNVKILGFCCM